MREANNLTVINNEVTNFKQLQKAVLTWAETRDKEWPNLNPAFNYKSYVSELAATIQEFSKHGKDLTYGELHQLFVIEDEKVVPRFRLRRQGAVAKYGKGEEDPRSKPYKGIRQGHELTLKEVRPLSDNPSLQEILKRGEMPIIGMLDMLMDVTKHYSNDTITGKTRQSLEGGSSVMGQQLEIYKWIQIAEGIHYRKIAPCEDYKWSVSYFEEAKKAVSKAESTLSALDIMYYQKMIQLMTKPVTLDPYRKRQAPETNTQVRSIELF